jgi:hypothetical protein
MENTVFGSGINIPDPPNTVLYSFKKASPGTERRGGGIRGRGYKKR